MSWTKAKDISQWQGNWQDTGEPIVLIKMSGGDAGLYMDSKAAANYEAAVKAGKAVGGYHFGGGVLSAEAEADYFLRAMSPVAENDVFALDVEAHLATRADVVQWSQDFCTYIHDHIGVWPIVYMNLSLLNAHDWTPVLNNSGLWLADWVVSPDANIPTHYTYVMQQYNDGPNYDHDAFFGTVEQFKAYGYHAQTVPVPQPAPAQPTPVETPQPTPEPVPTPPTETPATPATPPVAPETAPVPENTNIPTQTPTSQGKPSTPVQENRTLLRVIASWVAAFIKKFFKKG